MQKHYLPLRLSPQPEKSVLGSPTLMEPKTDQHGREQPKTHSMHFDHLYNSLQILTAAADGTYNVFLPEGIPGATQQ